MEQPVVTDIGRQHQLDEINRKLDFLTDQFQAYQQRRRPLEELKQDLQPLSKEVFDSLLERLEEMDNKGYFEFARETALIVDTVVTSFDVEDVRRLRENITYLLLTVKNLTQPEMLATMNNAVDFYRKMEVRPGGDVSYRDLIHELRKPETKRGLAFLIQFLQRMSEEPRALAFTNGKQTEV